MKNLALYIFLTVFCIISCKEDPIVAQNGCQEIRTVDKTYDTTSAYQVDKVKVDGDCIELTFSYGGGCKDVDKYLLHKASSNSEIIPLKLDLRDDDNCEALVTETARFDLTPFKDGSSGSVDFILETMSETVTYTW